MEMQNKFIKLIMTLLLLVSIIFLAKETAQLVMGNEVKEKQKCIVIDAGHPATSLGTENKTRPCVSMGDAL